jgi:SAM-dependent methyltransferase
MNYLKTEAALRAGYGAEVDQYRKDDEIEVTTAHHQRLAATLAAISSSFGRAISVLDVGCGTGRYFYCLKNVARLVGMDITPEMLAAARQPVNAGQISAGSVELVQGNIFFASFEPRSFDFIYSLGMFGHGCPVTVEVCDKLHSWLAPGGRLFFDTIDLAGLPWAQRARKQARKIVYRAAPGLLRRALDRRQNDTPFFGLTRRELAKILRASKFSRFDIASRVCESPLWQGRHLECVAVVPLSSASTAETRLRSDASASRKDALANA